MEDTQESREAAVETLVTQFKQTIESLSQGSRAQGALKLADDDLVQGRSLTEIAFDDMINMFETLHNGETDHTILLKSYQLLLQERSGKSVTEAGALKQLEDGLNNKKIDPSSRSTGFPSFIKIIQKTALPQEMADIANEWLQLSSAITNLASDMNFQQALATRQSFAKTVIDEFNMVVNGGVDPAEQKNTSSNTSSHEGKMNPSLKKLLDNFGEDLTEKAKNTENSAITGRDDELYQTTATIMQDNNPFALLVGPSGAGKTAIAEALAHNIASDNVPNKLKGAKVVNLKIREMKLQLGQGALSSLHQILKGVSEYNQQNSEQVILHIDELSTMNDRIPVFQEKNALATAMDNYKGLRLIGEISDSAYSSLQSDSPEMAARFQRVTIAPLSKDATKQLLKDKLTAMGHNHVDDKVLERIIQLTNRFVPARKQPGVSFDILDTAASYAELDGKPLDEEHVVKVISDQAGVPKEFVGSSVSERIAMLGDTLPKMVLGQDQAINKIIGSMKVANANLHDPDKPLGSFMLIGPTGVGKTETAKALADSLGVPLITEDMGNYQDQHAKAKLIGSPPGYVGFDKEAALEQVAKSPYCVLLLDEIEKAHGDVLNVLLSVLDEGRVQLMNGKQVDFKNCIVLMTSNLGAKDAQNARDSRSIGFGGQQDDTQKEQRAQEVMKKAINAKLPPEFINRLDGILTYEPLKIEVARMIAKSKVKKVSEFLREKNQNLHLELSDEAMEQLVTLGYEPRFGARPMDRAIKDRLKEPLAEWLLENAANITEPKRLVVTELENAFNLSVEPMKKAANGGNIPPAPPPAPKP